MIKPLSALLLSFLCLAPATVAQTAPPVQAAQQTLAEQPKTPSSQPKTPSSQPKWCSSRPGEKFKTLHRAPIHDTWFEVYEVSPSVFAIYEPRQSEATIGYLIVGSQRALLFDTGMGIGDLKLLTAELTKLPILVLNSHTHFDHVGGNWQFSTIYGMDTAFTRESARGSSADAQEDIQPSEICGELPPGFDAKTYATKPWKITRTIQDGEMIDIGGRSLQVIATPGHTPDAICLFDVANGLLFTGDTFYPGTIWLYRPETDLEAYGKSVRRLAALAPHVKVVFPAHNFPGASPTVLPALAAAFGAVQEGKIPPIAAGRGQTLYKSGEISFLVKAKQ